MPKKERWNIIVTNYKNLYFLAENISKMKNGQFQ